MKTLIGMFDSPFVRRVALSLKLLHLPFEHANWSTGKDAARIRAHNPLGRVPTLILDDGEALIDSTAILDYLDELATPQRRLIPANGIPRRDALKLLAITTGAAEKGVLLVYERIFRPAEMRSETWMQRCNQQMHNGLAALDHACATLQPNRWLGGERLLQTDVTAACVFSFLCEALPDFVQASAYPALQSLTARCEALPEFASTRQPFIPPST